VRACASPIFGLLLITHAEVHTPTRLTTKAGRRPRSIVFRRRDPVQEHQSTLRAYTWVGRHIPCVGGPRPLLVRMLMRS
jgi:hypothetical protein